MSMCYYYCCDGLGCCCLSLLLYYDENVMNDDGKFDEDIYIEKVKLVDERSDLGDNDDG